MKVRSRRSKSQGRYILLALFCLLYCYTTALAECNESQAFNRMMVFNQAWMGYQQRYYTLPQEQQAAEVQKFTSGSQRMAALSAKLASKEWNAVCSGYDALAKEYGFNLKQAGKGVVTVEELKKDGGRRGGSCSLADASKRFMQMQQKFQDKKANGELTLEEERAFFAATDPIGQKMTTDPSAVCKDVAAISKRFSLE